MSENTSAQKELTFAQANGIDYAYKLALSAIDRSEKLTHEQKRNFCYGALCFRSIFDNRAIVEPDCIINKYDCLTPPEPQRPGLYGLIYKIVTLDTATEEIKAMWYLMFPYAVMSEAEHEPEIFDKLKAELINEKVFDAVLNSRYSINAPDSVPEMWAAGLPSSAIEWYIPYISYKDERNEAGLTRETVRYQKLLALRQFETAYAGTEKLLNTFPDDEHLLLTNIAARISLCDVHNEKERNAMIRETVELIDEALLRDNLTKRVYFIYYRGISLLGLMETEDAREEFNKCLALDPNFELAKFMLKAMDKLSDQTQIGATPQH